MQFCVKKSQRSKDKVVRFVSVNSVLCKAYANYYGLCSAVEDFEVGGNKSGINFLSLEKFFQS